MRALTTREKRTIKIASMLLIAYVVVFYGTEGWQYLEGKRAEASQLASQIEACELKIGREKTKRQLLDKLRTSLRLDLESLGEDALVAKALTAIQTAAKTCSIGLGPSKEMQGNPALKELARFQLEGKGSIKAIIRFLHRLRNVGYPLVVEQLNLKASPKSPGAAELSLSVVVLDYQAWKETSRV